MLASLVVSLELPSRLHLTGEISEESLLDNLLGNGIGNAASALLLDHDSPHGSATFQPIQYRCANFEPPVPLSEEYVSDPFVLLTIQ